MEFLYDNNLMTSMDKIISAASDLKRGIYRESLMDGSRGGKASMIKYMNIVNNFLRFWDDYSRELQSKIKDSKADTDMETSVIEYQYMRDYLYANYDYAAVLQFTDGIFKGISSGRFSSTSDIEDFYDHTITKAFKTNDSEIGGLVDSVTFDGTRSVMSTSNRYEVNMYNSIRSSKLFNYRDRIELYNAIDKTLDYVTSNIQQYTKFGDIKIFIAMISNIVGFISYSLVAYACRIYIISRYAQPFINNKSTSKSDSIITESNNGYTVTILRDADDTIYRDPTKSKKLFELFNNFVNELGCGVASDSDITRYSVSLELKDNEFCKRLIGNNLYTFMVNNRYNSPLKLNDDTDIVELDQILKSTVYNNNPAIQISGKPKQELLQVIRGTGRCDTVKECQTLAKDLYAFTVTLCDNISDHIKRIDKWVKEEFAVKNYPPAIGNTATRCIRILGDFYREVAFAILQRGRDLEMRFNMLNNAVFNRTVEELTIKVPGGLKSDYNRNDNMMLSVPDTIFQVAVDTSDLYSTPVFESLEMYDEYLRMTPEFKDSLYLSEAINVSTIINAIMSKLNGLKKRWVSFWNNKGFKSAVKYVTDNEANLMKMTYNGSMEVIPYRRDIQINHIADMIKTLKSFDGNVVNSKESLDKFIKDLYTDERIYNVFNSDDKAVKEKAPGIYRNLVLFGREDDPGRVRIEGDEQIKEYLKVWIENVKGSITTEKGLNQTSSEVDAAINAFKSKVVGMKDQAQQTKKDNNSSNNGNSSEDNNNGTTEATPAAPPSGSTNVNESSTTSSTQPTTTQQSTGSATQSNAPTNNTQQNSQQNQSQGGEDKDALLNRALNTVQVAVDQLWGSLYTIITTCIKDEYKYIQEAYSIAAGKNK